jgi:hypothetical protein
MMADKMKKIAKRFGVLQASKKKSLQIRDLDASSTAAKIKGGKAPTHGPPVHGSTSRPPVHK